MSRLFALDQNFPQPLIERIAGHQNREVEDVLGEARLTPAERGRDPLVD